MGSSSGRARRKEPLPPGSHQAFRLMHYGLLLVLGMTWFVINERLAAPPGGGGAAALPPEGTSRAAESTTTVEVQAAAVVAQQPQSTTTTTTGLPGGASPPNNNDNKTVGLSIKEDQIEGMIEQVKNRPDIQQYIRARIKGDMTWEQALRKGQFFQRQVKRFLYGAANPRMSHVGKEMMLKPKHAEGDFPPYSPIALDDPPADPELDAFVAKYPESCTGQEPMLRTLKDAGMELHEVLCRVLPKWAEVVDLYGNGPVVLGLETCAAYRARMAERPDVIPYAKIAALCNTGSTALSKCFLNNFADYRHLRYNATATTHLGATVTWGKHTPLYLKYNSSFPSRRNENPNDLMPVLTVRDPFWWMQSSCKKPYSVFWQRGKDGRCPNFVPTDEERQLLPNVKDLPSYNATVFNMLTVLRFQTTYDSVADYWSIFNGDYLYADFPRLLVRTEDTFFYPRQLMKIISECTGMPMEETFEYNVDQANPRSDTTLVKGMIKYGRWHGRFHANITLAERHYLATHLNPELMTRMRFPPIPLTEEEQEAKLAQWDVSNLKRDMREFLITYRKGRR